MKRWVQPATPWDRSVHWALHDAWFAARGTAAWDDGEVPYEATSGHAAAMVNAEFLLRLVDQLEEDGLLELGAPVAVLEVGGGNGEFTANVLRVLAVGFGAAGRELLGRLQWVWSDYQERTVTEACARPALAEAVANGTVRPALLDLRDIDSLRMLDGEPAPTQWTAVFANYVACVVATRLLRWKNDDTMELCVGLLAEVASDAAAERLRATWLEDPTRKDLLEGVELEWSWQPVEEREPGLDLLQERLIEGTVSWPAAFLSFVQGVVERLALGGVVLVSDFGTASLEEVAGEQEPRPRHYGNTNNSGVDFVVFDAFAEHRGLGLLRTHDPLRSIHHAAFYQGPAQAQHSDVAFDELFVRQRVIDDWLDFSEAAENAEEDKEEDETLTALRWWERCARLAPYDADVHMRLGELSVDAELYERAERSLLHALKLDVHGECDAPFHLGRLYSLTSRTEESVSWYLHSLEKEDHPVAWANLGGVYEDRGEVEQAVDAYRRALALDPHHRRSRTRLNALT